MIVAWPFGAKFFHKLLETDLLVLRETQRGGCRSCGGRLDRADFPRKPRGLPESWEATFCRRFSLCCDREGCRRRLTPPSVRFLGRRVYVAAVVLLAVVAEQIAVPRRTRRRWAAWWVSAFTETAFWRVARARLTSPVDASRLPGSLVARFAAAHDGADAAVLRALAFISPITASSSFSRDGP